MSVNLQPIYTKFLSFIRTTLDGRLANHPGTTVGAVYPQKDPNQRGVYPYSLVALSNIDEQAGLMEFYDDSGNLVTATNWAVDVKIAIYSTDTAVENQGWDRSAEQLAMDLRSRLTSREALCEFSDTGEIEEIFGVSLTNFKRDGEVGEAAIFDLRFTVYGEEVDLETYEMNEVNADLHLRYDGSDDNVVSTTIIVEKP